MNYIIETAKKLKMERSEGKKNIYIKNLSWLCGRKDEIL